MPDSPDRLLRAVKSDDPEAFDLAIAESEAAEKYGQPPPGWRYDLSLARQPDGSPATVRITGPVDERGRPQVGGHPKHVPTDETRKAVLAYRMCGMSAEKIATLLEVGKDTIYRHYASELKPPPTLLPKAIEATLTLLSERKISLTTITTDPESAETTTVREEYHAPDARLALHILKTQGGLAEKVITEHTGANGGAIAVDLTVQALASNLARVNAKRAAVPELPPMQDAHDTEREPDDMAGADGHHAAGDAGAGTAGEVG